MSAPLLKGRVALITGAARGIGRAIALRCVEEGADLVITDRDQDELVETEKRLQALSGRVRSVVGDLTDAELPEALVEAAQETFGRLDVVVNNAGIEHRASVEGHTPEAWEKVLKVNLTAPFLVVRAALPLLRESQGAIVNIGSTAITGFRGQIAYDASKGGVLSMTRSMAADLGRHGIRANAVSPGFIATDMVLDEPELVQLGERHCRTQPIPRMGRPDEIAAAVVWLASDQASYVTGQGLYVDGGWIRS